VIGGAVVQSKDISKKSISSKRKQNLLMVEEVCTTAPPITNFKFHALAKISQILQAISFFLSGNNSKFWTLMTNSKLLI